MILVAQRRALVLLLCLLMLLGGPVMAMVELQGEQAVPHSFVDAFGADHDQGNGGSQQECGSDHCSAGLFPRFAALSERLGVLVYRNPSGLLSPPPRYLFRPPRTLSFSQAF